MAERFRFPKSRETATYLLCAEYTKRYQDILLRLPKKALDTDKAALREMDEADEDRMAGAIRAYIDLCAEQEFMHRVERAIPDGIWENWSVGIRNMFTLPAMQQAWAVMHKLQGYEGLETLVGQPKP